MRLIVVMAMLFACTISAFATVQEAEWLILNGVTNQMDITPLDAYFTTNNPWPDVWKQVEKDIFNSGCWRRYIGTWAIRDGQLFLDNLRFCAGSQSFPLGTQVIQNGATNTYTSPVALLLPGKSLPFKADWFSGVIRLPQGRQLQYVHMGFGSIYERDHFIKFEKGRVVAEKTVNNLDDPKLYTSQSDLEWQQIGKMTEVGGVVTDDPFGQPREQDDPFALQQEHPVQGNWQDARMIRTTNFLGIVTSGTPFMTRGVFVYARDPLFGDNSALFIPPTPLTPPDNFPLADVPSSPKIANGAHVEIDAQFVKTKKGYALHVISIRELKNNESIHRRDYRLPNQASQATSLRAEPAR